MSSASRRRIRSSSSGSRRSSGSTAEGHTTAFLQLCANLFFCQRWICGHLTLALLLLLLLAAATVTAVMEVIRSRDRRSVNRSEQKLWSYLPSALKYTISACQREAQSIPIFSNKKIPVSALSRVFLPCLQICVVR